MRWGNAKTLSGDHFQLTLRRRMLELPPREFGALEVKMYDVAGAPINGVPELDFFRADALRHQTPLAVTANRLPFGEYYVRVRTPWFHASWQYVAIARARETLRVHVTLGAECSRNRLYGIGGFVRADGDLSGLWVKAVPLRGNGGSEAQVDSKGRFSVGALEARENILLVMDGNRVVHQSVVTATDTEFEIRVKR